MHTYCSYKDELPKELCKGLANIGKELDKDEAKVYKEGNDIKMKEVRNNRIAWLENPELTSILQLYAEKANQEAGWNFNINCYETPQVSFYGKGQFYNWHMDTGVETVSDTYVRKLSMSVTLDDNFKGGDFQIQDWVHPQDSKKFSTLKDMRRIGSITVFPSFMFHRVTKVKEGERCSLVCWFRGEPFQ
jgi:PKHD-type hydroxylase|tara:strand:- start:3723 stop:4289 length:567 start_codon:yes stop_codon:yes gene_type:complete